MVNELLTVSEMYRADAMAMAAGISGPRLMEAAGWAVAREVRRRFPHGRVAILCGPGNNGGDGFVAARLLERDGWAVRLSLLGDMGSLRGDAAIMAGRWRGRVEPLSAQSLDGCDCVIDALFGAGLARPLDGVVAHLVGEMNRRRLPVLAVDVPSGVHGDSAMIMGAAPDCVATVTFFRRKPGHCLLPGRLKCGDVVVADIGIPASVLSAIGPTATVNGPGCWTLPSPRPDGHKYDRGHALVVGGATMTGAARLAARAARRVGAGLASIAAPAEAGAIYRSGDPGNIVADLADLGGLLADSRRNAVLIGPGCGVGPGTSATVLAALGAGKACVVDADALTGFGGNEGRLFGALSPRSVLTPHDGEFYRLFGAMEGSRLVRARAAARRSGAVVVLKGGDTVIAHPDGRAVITIDASPWLASAGTGDVLAGVITGLMAQGMEAFAAASAAVWLHGQAAAGVGPGLIAEDLADALGPLLKALETAG